MAKNLLEEAKQKVKNLFDEVATPNAQRGPVASMPPIATVGIPKQAIRATVAHVGRLHSSHIAHAGDAHERCFTACNTAYTRLVKEMGTIHVMGQVCEKVCRQVDVAALDEVLTGLDAAQRYCKLGCRVSFNRLPADGTDDTTPTGPVEVVFTKSWVDVTEDAHHVAEAMSDLALQEAEWDARILRAFPRSSAATASIAH